MNESTPPLSPAECRALRASAHHLQPVVAIAGNGLTPAVLKEIDLCLKAHGLIKVKLHSIERQDRIALLDQICAELACAPVQNIGNILILWRPKPEGEEEAATPRRRRKPAPKNKKQAAAALERKARKK
jgi:RNA-binding protein